jgi:hypothetical protein
MGLSWCADFLGLSSRFRTNGFIDISPAFGFVAALLERLPIIGLVFSVSNRIGAAMWAHGKSELLVSSLGCSTILDTLQISRNANISSRKPASIRKPMSRNRGRTLCL